MSRGVQGPLCLLLLLQEEEDSDQVQFYQLLSFVDKPVWTVLQPGFILRCITGCQSKCQCLRLQGGNPTFRLESLVLEFITDLKYVVCFGTSSGQPAVWCAVYVHSIHYSKWVREKSKELCETLDIPDKFWVVCIGQINYQPGNVIFWYWFLADNEMITDK